jgi:hypothetical protein
VTTLAVGEFALTRYNGTGALRYLLLLPLALLNHLEVTWELDSSDVQRSALAVRVGFSL